MAPKRPQRFTQRNGYHCAPGSPRTPDRGSTAKTWAPPPMWELSFFFLIKYLFVYLAMTGVSAVHRLFSCGM